MKKFLVAFCLLFGIVGNSWGVCELSESTDRTPSDEDLYPQDPNVSRMALICQKGKCEEDEIVYMDVVPHYIGNMFNSEGFTTVNDKAYYRCKIGGNDKWKTATNVDLSVSDERQDLIVFSDSKQMFIYGKKSSDGNYYTNVHFVKPDEKCDVKCTPDNSGNYIYCDESLWICSDVGKFSEADNSPFGFCKYSDPQTRTDSYTVENEWATYPGWSLWGAAALRQGDDVEANMSFCMGCKSGFFSGGDNKCYNKLDEAWCNWQKNKNSKNTEWKDDKCNCLDSGVEWNTEQHDCVKTKKTSGSSTGGSGSGKTGGGSSGNGKLGSGKADEKCGVKCDKGKEYQFFYCNKDIIHCVPDLSGGYEFDENSSFFFNVCEYSDPVNFVAEHAQRYEMVEVSFYSGDGYNGNMDLMGPAGLKNGDKVSLSDPFCRVCKPGTYKDFYGKNCYKNENEAWCKWRKNKDKLNTDWQNGECKCLDPGMKWDTTTHNCIADNGAGGTSGRTKSKCEINIAASVKCRQNTTFSGTVELDLSPEICEKYKTTPNEHLYEIARELCADFGGVASVLSDADIQDAQKRIDKFLQYSESNTSVWKNAEGKFNTARLASDATAGVILGTVGGIVSAKVIKKKQVEKGFGALHCTISGQKVADWGDEFRVGLGMR